MLLRFHCRRCGLHSCCRSILHHCLSRCRFDRRLRCGRSCCRLLGSYRSGFDRTAYRKRIAVCIHSSGNRSALSIDRAAHRKRVAVCIHRTASERSALRIGRGLRRPLLRLPGGHTGYDTTPGVFTAEYRDKFLLLRSLDRGSFATCGCLFLRGRVQPAANFCRQVIIQAGLDLGVGNPHCREHFDHLTR